ncbi:hypothetical protein D9O40_00660 [Clostridium autoethanogenum]|uniref:Uncharacterized protein n=1 Tax=Clostridium autoethanogenum TaxID=84023 RepID=A0A3M0T2P5_9CLOT|nr:hypothetical protein [Clostridium autoethanogenum]RMD04897.1 hypothetical protein D9O40_00660 [Clostridium autoethanogenum]
MQTTANYALKKPDGTDVVDIQNFNDNADIIDSELKKRALQADLSSHLADNTAHGIGDRSKLLTTAKDNFVNAINEVFQSGTSVKSSTISAVNSKGQSLSTTATWDQIIAAINSIARGQGNAVETQVLSGVDFSNSDGKLRHGSMPNNGAINITPSGSTQTIPAGYTGGGSVSAVSVPVANVLSGTTIAGQVGTMKNNGAVSGTITNQGQSVSIPEGYTKGGSIVANFANLIASNIKKDVNIGSIIGSLDIESLGGKRYAEGNGTFTSSASFTIAGLNFTPSKIFVRVADYQYGPYYAYCKGYDTTELSGLAKNTTANLTINSDGFVAGPFYGVLNTTYTWKAIE